MGVLRTELEQLKQVLAQGQEKTNASMCWRRKRKKWYWQR
jgi:hypothetical protein